ncbi:nuclear envelope integral membrane protein 1-like isoform X3 [Varroa jacobsoni]|nr:nuclear envelope integral membrane protein 1-like isoform X3 [Varroa jacobsoni]
MLLLLAVTILLDQSDAQKSVPVTELTSKGGTNYSGSGEGKLEIFCYRARPYSPFGVFSSSRLEYRILPPSYALYEGESEQEVHYLHGNASQSWLPVLFQRKHVSFPPFTNKCIGIVSSYAYSFVFREYNIDYFRLLQCVASLALFFYARNLVHSPAIFYSGGALLGVLASILLLIFLLKRLFPGGRMTVAAMFVTGWSFWIYLLLQLWNSKFEIFCHYKHYFLAYIGLSAGIAFLICYRIGPPKDERTIDTMQILMQFVALNGVYFSSDAPEVTLAFCIIALLAYNFPARMKARFTTWLQRRFFKPTIRMLTEEEYIRQGDETTARELERLRDFARSPDCDAWKVMSRLRNPSRFGSFVLGESHLQDSEILEYETTGAHFDDDSALTHDTTDDDDGEHDVDIALRRNLLAEGARSASRYLTSASSVLANGNHTGNHLRNTILHRT